MTDIVERLRTVDISWNQEGEWCAEAADEIINLRKDKKMAFELMDVFVKEINRLKRGLHQIASMSDDHEFGAPSIITVKKIALNALEEE